MAIAGRGEFAIIYYRRVQGEPFFYDNFGMASLDAVCEKGPPPGFLTCGTSGSQTFLNKSPKQVRNLVETGFPGGIGDCQWLKESSIGDIGTIYAPLLLKQHWWGGIPTNLGLRPRTPFWSARYGVSRWRQSTNQTDISYAVDIGAGITMPVRERWSIAPFTGVDDSGNPTNAQETFAYEMRLTPHVTGGIASTTVSIVAGDTPATVATKIYNALVNLGCPDVAKDGNTVSWYYHPNGTPCEGLYMDGIIGLVFELRPGVIEDPSAPSRDVTQHA